MSKKHTDPRWLPCLSFLNIRRFTNVQLWFFFYTFGSLYCKIRWKSTAPPNTNSRAFVQSEIPPLLSGCRSSLDRHHHGDRIRIGLGGKGC